MRPPLVDPRNRNRSGRAARLSPKAGPGIRAASPRPSDRPPTDLPDRRALGPGLLTLVLLAAAIHERLRYDAVNAEGVLKVTRALDDYRDAGAIPSTLKRSTPGRLDLQVECHESAGLVLKLTYHPNWRITIDEQEVRAFMVSPSYIGLAVPAGRHHLRAEYRSPAYKTALLLLGAACLMTAIVYRRRFARLDALVASGGARVSRAARRAGLSGTR